MYKKIPVDIEANKSLSIVIGAGIIGNLGDLFDFNGHSSSIWVTDTATSKLYGKQVAAALKATGKRVLAFTVPRGENSKSLKEAERGYRFLMDNEVDRKALLCVLGGGVVGDLGGYIAATYLRGLDYIQLPTTLLAQVDSSVGGKVAVDHGQLKNMIGAFYQPQMVIADTSTLKSLPGEELVNGLAEVIKSAAIRDGRFFSFLEENMEKIKSLDEDILEETVYQSVKIKAEVVVEDELDMGLRHILNYGHTIGHAVESVSDFKIKHGRAVAVGMMAAARIADKLGMLGEDEVKRLQKLIARAGLPAETPDLNVAEVMQAMQHDKKVREGKARFVLLKSIGDAVVTDDVSPTLIEEVLTENVTT